MTDPDQLATRLLGAQLEGGWRVTKLVVRDPHHTGGYFSRSFLVMGESGKEGFLKALDYSRALEELDPARALQSLTQAFIFEQELLVRCRDRGLSRVIRPLAYGVYRNPPDAIPIQYIIFEKASGDARSQLIALESLDHVWALRTLHQMAAGLRQLHGEGIAHQDLKPSNVLHFTADQTKIADLGRASARGQSAPHDGVGAAGDQTYAPPELLYGSIDPEWGTRRLACDLYLLGSLGVSFYLGSPMTASLMARMHDDHHWLKWGDSYNAVMPYIRPAFSSVVEELEGVLPRAFSRELATAVRHLCEPDPKRRGHPADIAQGNRYSLHRFVTLFDLLAKRARIHLART